MKLKTLMIVFSAISLVSLVVSIVALCLGCPRSLEFDYIGLIVGILAILITVLMAWNIYTVISFKDEVKRITKQTMSDNTLSEKDVNRIIDSVF